jgi:hypothetical protein
MNIPHNIFTDPKNETTFRQDGYIVLEQFKPADIQALLAIFSEFEPEHELDAIATVLLSDKDMLRTIHQRVAPIFERCLYPVLNRYKFILGNFVAKRAASAYGKFPLHQDSTFVEEDEHIGITIWCPLIDVDKHNGCLGVVPGSHRLNNYYRAPCILPYPHLLSAIELDYMHYIPMRVGQVMLMDNRVIHGSPSNLSSTMRPVAAGVAIPEAAPLLCCYRDEQSDAENMQVYQVPDDFYLRYTMLSHPQEGQLYKTVPHRIEALTIEKAQSMFQAVA